MENTTWWPNVYSSFNESTDIIFKYQMSLLDLILCKSLPTLGKGTILCTINTFWLVQTLHTIYPLSLETSMTTTKRLVYLLNLHNLMYPLSQVNECTTQSAHTLSIHYTKHMATACQSCISNIWVLTLTYCDSPCSFLSI